MLSNRVGILLRDARRQLGLSQSEVARRGKVSTRLVAEVERGQRPNVSLETTLQLLHVLGVTMRLVEPSGAAIDLKGPNAALFARQARAARRRETWTGVHVPLKKSGLAPSGGRTIAERLTAVSRVSRQAYVIAQASSRKGTPLATKRSKGATKPAAKTGRTMPGRGA